MKTYKLFPPCSYQSNQSRLFSGYFLSMLSFYSLIFYPLKEVVISFLSIRVISPSIKQTDPGRGFRAAFSSRLLQEVTPAPTVVPGLKSLKINSNGEIQMVILMLILTVPEQTSTRFSLASSFIQTAWSMHRVKHNRSPVRLRELQLLHFSTSLTSVQSKF